MKFVVLNIALGAIFFAIVVPQAHSRSSYYEVRGVVLDQRLLPIGEAEVYFSLGPRRVESRNALTFSDGLFSASPTLSPTGQHQLSVIREGFKPIDGVSFFPGRDFNIVLIVVLAREGSSDQSYVLFGGRDPETRGHTE